MISAMRFYITRVLATLWLCCLASMPLAADSDHLQTYQQLKTLSFDGARGAQIEDFTLRKADGSIHFEKGTLYFAAPVRNQDIAAVFLGRGRFRLKPPGSIEQAQVRRFLETDSIDKSFTAAYFRFSDGDAVDPADQLIFEKQDIPNSVESLHRKMDEFLLKERGANLASMQLGNLQNPGSGNFFFAAFEHTEESFNFPSYFILTIDQQAQEDIGVFQAYPHRPGKPFYTLCSYPAATYLTKELRYKTPLTDDAGSAIRIDHYNLDVDLEPGGDIRCRARLTLRVNGDSLSLLPFRLLKELEIDSVKNGAGDALAYVQEEDESGFSVLLAQPTQAGNNLSLSIFYSGRLFDKRNGHYQIKNNIFWYPRIGYLMPATYDVTYRSARDMQVVSNGRRVRQWQQNNQNCSQWLEQHPTDAFAFAFGRFDSTQFTFRDSLPVVVYSTKSSSSRARKNIGEDVISSLYFFERILGPYPYQKLTVVETPGPISNGFAGILFLTSLTFSNEIEGVMESLRGHEVSHQWWGNLVGWQSYHDQWLSEAFAEYSGALINQFLLDGDQRFFQMLEGWQNDLLNKGHIGVSVGLRRFGFSKSDLAHSDGIEAGPIWLGQRLGTRYPVDYYINVYVKGAYVVHMLRTMLHDFETGSDHRFWQLLADLVQTHKGRKITTADFKRLTDKHFGMDMSWFFDQWIYDTVVPTYLYSYEMVQNDGHYVVLRIEQKDAPPEFRAKIPVTVVFQQDRRQTTLVDMSGESKSFKLGPFPNNPIGLHFNDFYGVLARVRSK